MKINEIMDSYGVNLTDIAEQSGISKTTLSNAFKRSTDSWTIRILNGVALALNETPSKVLVLLQGDHYRLQINDQDQTIQGVHITDPDDYRNIKFAVKNNVMEGWRPTRADIEDLKAFIGVPHPELETEYRETFGENDG